MYPSLTSLAISLFCLLPFAITQCATYCGVDNQFCCKADEVCYTNANSVAYCSRDTSLQTTGCFTGQWEIVTETRIETDIRTIINVYSSYFQVPTSCFVPPISTSSATVSCSNERGDIQCGSVCCASGQYCAALGKCVAISTGSTGSYTTFYSVTTTSIPSTTTPSLTTVTIAKATYPPNACVVGWFLCASSVGGGCCPTGYDCGASCVSIGSAATTAMSTG